MGEIKNGDLVAVSVTNDGVRVGTRCYMSSANDTFTLPIKYSDGEQGAIWVLPMTNKNDIGYKAYASDDEPAAVTIAKASFIAMAWIDEASPCYTNYESVYVSDLELFNSLAIRSIKWSASCQSPKNTTSTSQGIARCVNTDVGYPQDLGVNIYMENVNRSPNITASELTSMFDTLLAEFKATPPLDITYPEYVILTIDVSGSMNESTIQPAYSSLVSYISTKCSDSIIKQTSYSNEAWLNIWYEQILDII